MTDSILLRETRGHIRILTINRPERSNAMSPELTDELIDARVAKTAHDQDFAARKVFASSTEAALALERLRTTGR